MSFNLGSGRVHQVIVLALTLIFVFAVFYSSIEAIYKVGIAALAFTMLLLLSIANQVLKQQEEEAKKRQH